MTGDAHRFHLSIPRPLWRALQREARATGRPMSRVVAERLEEAMPSGTGRADRSGIGAAARPAGRRQWTVRLDGDLCRLLLDEARRRMLPVAAVIREWLWRAAQGGSRPHDVMSGPSDGRDDEVPGWSGTKQIALAEF